MSMKEESEKADLKLNIQKTRIVASGPITLWQIERESGSSDRFSFLGSKIIVDGDFCHEMKRCLLLGRKAMTNLDSILKSRDISWAPKVCLVKDMVFPAILISACDSSSLAFFSVYKLNKQGDSIQP